MKAKVEDSRKINDSVYRRRRDIHGEIFYTKEINICYEEYRQNVLQYEKQCKLKDLLKN